MPEPQLERRRMQRCDMQEAVTVKFWDHGPREATGMVQNASPDGVFFRTKRPIPEQAKVELVFLFPATLRSPGVRFVCRCKVIRAQQKSDDVVGIAAAILRTESERISLAQASAFEVYEAGLVQAD